MSAVTAIRNIHELTPDPKTGISRTELEAVYLQNRASPFQVPAPVRPEKPEYLSLPEEPAGNEGISFLGKWFESESAKAERHAENLRRWQQELIDVERDNTLRQHRYQQQRTAGPNSMQTGSLMLKNMKNGSPRLRQMPDNSSGQMPRF